MYRLLESRYEPVKGEWEERWERKYGFWRGSVDGAVARFLDCGVLENGFARARCAGCGSGFLVAFSCKGRGLCPSCGAKRGVLAALRLREEVLEEVAHAQWVFTIPKMLRSYFLRNRELLGGLCRAAWETAREMLVAGAGEEIRPGMVTVIQTFGSEVNWHPHLHSLVSRGGWTPSGKWVPVPSCDPHTAELLFRHRVLALLRNAGLLEDDRIALLLSWQHTGFSAHNSVVVEPEDPEGVERLVRYLMRPPVSLERLAYDEETGRVELRSRPGSDEEESGDEVVRLDSDELVARVIVQVPEPRKHVIRYYGFYGNAARAKRAREGANESGGEASAVASGLPEVGRSSVSKARRGDTEATPKETDPERKAAARRWAELIRHIFEIDPLVCPSCGAEMKIISFITGRPAIRAILEAMRRPKLPAPPPDSRPPPPRARPGGGAGR